LNIYTRFKQNLIDTAFISSVSFTALKVITDITGQFKSQRDEVNLRNAPVKITNVEIFGQFILCRVQKLKFSITQIVGQLLMDYVCLYTNVAARYVHSKRFFIKNSTVPI